jgi:CO/xanthine dehydrogenase Mo-binding subunit
VAAHDCGRIVNPLMVDSQVIGAVTQGIGFALTEERLVDMGRGFVVNANLEHYLVPTMLDVPPITNVHLNLPDTVANPTGAKGIGESPLVPTAPAIANAVFDAIGVRIRQTPLSRRRVLTALGEVQDVDSTAGPGGPGASTAPAASSLARGAASTREPAANGRQNGGRR